MANPRDTLYCNFCGKPQSAVKKLVEGNGHYICNECVDGAASKIADTHGPLRGAVASVSYTLGYLGTAVDDLSRIGLNVNSTVHALGIAQRVVSTLESALTNAKGIVKYLEQVKKEKGL